jgi:hypothetical protein
MGIGSKINDLFKYAKYSAARSPGPYDRGWEPAPKMGFKEFRAWRRSNRKPQNTILTPQPRG